MAEWYAGPPLPAPVIQGGATVDPGTGRIWVITGFDPDNSGGNERFATARVYYLDPGASAWVAGPQFSSQTNPKYGYPVALGVTPAGVLLALFQEGDGNGIQLWRWTGTAWATSNLPVTTLVDAGLVFDAQGRGYVVGGYRSGAQRTEVYRYTHGVGWETLAPLPTAVRGARIAAGPDGTIYTVRPTAAQNVRYDPAADAWAQYPTPPAERDDGAAFVDVAGVLHYTGGHTDWRREAFVDGYATYSPALGTWKTEPATGDHARRAFHVSVVDSSGRLWFIGGVSTPGSYNSGTPTLTTSYAVTATPPLAPTLLAPADGTVLDRGVTNRFGWKFNDPNAYDTQGAYQYRYRLRGATGWTVLPWAATAAQHWDAPAGTFTEGDYEWQVATRDQGGMEGPFSPSGYFTARAAPAEPTLIAPVHGGDIPTAVFTVRWETPTQEAYQIQVLDQAGNVVVDTGTVSTATARSRLFEFPDNGTTRTVQIRIYDAGLWSQWRAATATVDYTTPATPTLSVGADHTAGTLTINPTFPPPTGTEPSTVSYDLWVRGGPEGQFRLAAGITPSRPVLWWLPASGVDYEFRIRADADNDTFIWSEWSGTEGEPVYEPGQMQIGGNVLPYTGHAELEQPTNPTAGQAWLVVDQED